MWMAVWGCVSMSTTLSKPEPAVASHALLKGKKIAVFGVANKWSIAWSIAQSLSQAGAHLVITYIDERTEDKVRQLVANLPHALVLPCNVTKDDQVEAVFQKIKHEFGTLDGLVHAIAYAKKEELEGSFLKTSREGFNIALDVSAYS